MIKRRLYKEPEGGGKEPRLEGPPDPFVGAAAPLLFINNDSEGGAMGSPVDWRLMKDVKNVLADPCNVNRRILNALNALLHCNAGRARETTRDGDDLLDLGRPPAAGAGRVEN